VYAFQYVRKPLRGRQGFGKRKGKVMGNWLFVSTKKIKYFKPSALF
jgi:hypothetical protein